MDSEGDGTRVSSMVGKNHQFDDFTPFLFGDFSAMFEYTEGWFEGKCMKMH